MNLYKSTKLGVLIIGAISVLLYIIVSSTTEQIIADNGSVSLTLFLIMSYITMFLSVAFVLYFVFKAIAADKETRNKTLKIIGVFTVIIVISALIADNTPYDEYKIGSGYSRAISTGLNVFYFTALAAVVTIVYTSVKKKNY